MNINKILIGFFIVFISLFFVLNATYFTNKQNSENFSLKNNVGMYEIQKSIGGYSLENPSKNQTQKIYSDNINYLDFAYFTNISPGNYKKEIIGNNINFTITKGFYLFDLNDLSNNFSIKNEFFEIKPKSNGKILIDSTDEKNVKIFSLNSVSDLIFKENNLQMTKMSLYPHMFVGFNSTRNKFIKNADLLRLDTLFEINYVDENIFDNKNKLNLELLTKLYNKNDDFFVDFLNKSMYFAFGGFNFDKYNKENLILLKDKKIPGSDFIDKYFVLFLNKEKKIIYYKKQVIYSLNNLFEEKDETKIQQIKTQIIENLDILKDLDQKQYAEFESVLLYYYKNISNINQIDFFPSQIAILDILKKFKNKTNLTHQNSYLYISKVYSLLNQNHLNKSLIQLNLLDFVKEFSKENNIKIEGGNVYLNDKKNTLEVDYLSFFIKNVLYYNLSFSKNNNFSDVINLINIYFSINSNLNKISNNQKSETLIIEYFSLMQKLLQEIRDNFFEKNLGDNGLLVLNRENPISRENLIRLDIAMKLFFQFKSINNSYISPKNAIYNQYYKIDLDTYSQYILALNNYDEYLVKFDKSKNSLLSSKTIFEIDKSKPLDRNSLVKYLSNFEGVDLSKMSFTIDSGKVFRVKGVYINSQIFSFDLFPYEFNRIQNIYQSGKKLTASYELDIIQKDWDEIYKTSGDEDKTKFDFKMFFLNTFFQTTQIKQNQIFVQDKEINIQDKAAIIFKRDKLFGQRGDFYLLKGFVDFSFNDVLVELVNGNYQTKVNNSTIRTSSKTYFGDEKSISNMQAEYVFSDKDHYFKNITLKFFDEELFERGEKEAYLFGGAKIKIDKNIPILEFKNEIDKIITNIISSKSVYENIVNVFGINLVDINIDKTNVIYSFTYKNKNIYISASGETVNLIKVNQNNILNNKNIKYNELAQFLNTLK